MSSDTPLTDEAALGLGRLLVEPNKATWTELVDSNFARQLERDLSTARKELEAARDENFVFKEIAELIGTIYVHGNFIAETFNERELEKRLRKVGCFWDSLESYDAHKFPELESRRQG